MNNLINWSEVSRLLTEDRTAIRKDYSGKKYKELVNCLKDFEKVMYERIDFFKENGV